MNKKEFRLHEQSGLWVARDGEVFVPKSGNYPEHYTYGSKNKLGYWQVSYQGKKYYVHRLVAECYITNDEGKPYIDHIIPVSMGGTNDVSNLRWCTQGENNNNELTRKKKSEAQKGKHKYNNPNPKKPVIGVNKTTGEIVEFESATDAWLTLNINNSHIAACCRGERGSAGGWKWSYLT